MRYRNKIVEKAKWWAAPGQWRPFAHHMVYFFDKAGTEVSPTMQEAEEALKRGGTGVKVQGKIKHWCGIFACCVIREAGLTAPRWTLLGGKIKPLKLVWGNSGMQPGDIAIIKEANHHFIVTDVDYSTKTMRTVEGNTFGQYIKTRERNTTEPYAYYRIPE